MIIFVLLLSMAFHKVHSTFSDMEGSVIALQQDTLSWPQIGLLKTMFVILFKMWVHGVLPIQVELPLYKISKIPQERMSKQKRSNWVQGHSSHQVELKLCNLVLVQYNRRISDRPFISAGLVKKFAFRAMHFLKQCCAEKQQMPGILLLTLSLCLMRTNAANILALVVTPSPSHHIWNRALMLELAARGHNVTVVSPDPEKHKVPNHTDIVIEGMYEELHEAFDYEAMGQENILENYISIFEWGTHGCKKGLASSGAKTLLGLVGKQAFDLIIVEAVLDECFHGFVPLFGSPPLMAITAYSMPPWAGDMTGSPNTASYINVGNLPYPKHLSFTQRMVNFLVHCFTSAYRKYVHLPKQDKIAQEFFGPHIPKIEDIEKNISIVLANIHHSYDYPRPLSPTLIPVGGMHIKPAKPLPKELQQYIDDAPHGVILFSLGSNIRSDKLKLESREALLSAFAKLKEKILWKWESESLPNQPGNVKISKWLPQNDILAHSKVRLFITHGGLLSSQEALYHGIPMIGIPFLADQHINLERNVQRGVAEKLDVQALTTERIVETIRKVLDDPSYKLRMKKLSNLFRDRPASALTTAVWWTEYVIRHKGANHLKSAAIELPWYKYFLLDVISVLIVTFVTILFLLRKLFNLIRSICFKTRNSSVKEKRN